ncbi:MAG: hypothetical protein LBB29_01930 [Holosporaceae bacterium]|nr:hypothetical protein [Holosporaceae bacterium]
MKYQAYFPKILEIVAKKQVMQILLVVVMTLSRSYSDHDRDAKSLKFSVCHSLDFPCESVESDPVEVLPTSLWKGALVCAKEPKRLASEPKDLSCGEDTSLQAKNIP